MSKLGRRKFLVYGSAGVATSLLLKSCASSETPPATDSGTDSGANSPC